MRSLWGILIILVLLTVAGQPTPGYALSLTFFTGRWANSVRQYTLTQQTHTLDTGTICIIVYNDTNGSTVRDPGEPLLPGAIITVTNSSGFVVATYTTNGVSEPYCLTGLPPDTYTLREQNPPGYPISTTPDVWAVTLSPGATYTVPFGDRSGVTPTPTATAAPTGGLCVMAFNDLDGDGVFRPDRMEYPLAGALITVTNLSSVLVITRTTDATEPLCFFLAPGVYTVTERNPADYPFSSTADVLTRTVVAGSNVDAYFGDRQSPSPTATPTGTATPTPTRTVTPTPTPTNVSTSTPTPTSTHTRTPTPTPTKTLTPMLVARVYLPIIVKNYLPPTPIPTSTLTPTPTPSRTPTPTPTSTATPTPTPWCDPYEPNNDRYTNPWGPLQSAQTYQAKLCTGDAEDNYFFDVGTPNPVQLRLQLPGSLVGNTSIWLYAPSDLQNPRCGGWVNRSEYTTTCSIPQLGRYIIRLYTDGVADDVDPYTLRATFQ